ncbi:hypothetical protein GCM10009775_28960 [Microbacterium aoyamense]|uniref:Uncharacterized protein n=1 Tax=Microbacterium aoyamense TaxID=344166 RepID=A0ABN2PZ31_9MICO
MSCTSELLILQLWIAAGAYFSAYGAWFARLVNRGNRLSGGWRSAFAGTPPIVGSIAGAAILASGVVRYSSWATNCVSATVPTPARVALLLLAGAVAIVALARLVWGSIQSYRAGELSVPMPPADDRDATTQWRVPQPPVRRSVEYVLSAIVAISLFIGGYVA